MKNTLLFIFTIFILAFWSCQSVETDFGIASNYFPDSNVLNKGIVNKYYSHNKENGSYNTNTGISYCSYQLTKSNGLTMEYYNPGFKRVIAKELSFRNEEMLLLKEERYIREDTISVEINKQVAINWEVARSESEKTATYSLGTRKWYIVQQQIRDTILLDQPAKIFEGIYTLTIVFKGDTTEALYQYQKIYVKGLGLYSYYHEDEKGKNWLELVEQIPLTEFQRLAKHDRQRVAYIDPKKTIDKSANFKLCKIHNRIFDYYNGGYGHIYIGGKKALKELVLPQLDKSKLFNESGFLTFRFIVNCEGKAGCFVTEQADFNYQKKEFNPETIDYFYKILSKIEQWKPTVIRGEKVDAYVYLTFKLKDNEIIEILP